jgi:hypothetical protein
VHTIDYDGGRIDDQESLMSEDAPAESGRPFPQEGRERLVLTAPVGRLGAGLENPEPDLVAQLRPGVVMMMGDNPALPRMPQHPTLLDFFRYRFEDVTARHLLTSAKRALDAGLSETVVTACLLHDISNGCFVRTDHGYWGAQMIAPYVSEEVAWAVQYHQPLRYFADESVGYAYPESYKRFFGPDYVPPDYIRRDAEIARAHRWYMTSRLVTLNDIYVYENAEQIDPEIFEDIIGRNFRQPSDGLGFDGSPVAHMWRTMIWPNNFI